MFHRALGCCGLAGLALLAGLVGANVGAQDLVKIPALQARVMDTTSTLSTVARQALEEKLAGFEQAHGTQIVVLLVASTQPEDIAAYAQRVGDAWKIGRAQVGDGLLVVVAKNDRKVRIQTSKALEGAIPDLAARQVIETALTPRFKQGDFAGGLNAAVDQLMLLVQGENLPAPQASSSQKPTTPITSMDGWSIAKWLFLAMVGVLGWIFTSVLWVGAALLFVFVFVLPRLRSWDGSVGHASSWSSSGSSWGSRGGGSSSSGGFSSGGGGDFGGGGASGDW